MQFVARKKVVTAVKHLIRIYGFVQIQRVGRRLPDGIKVRHIAVVY